MTVRIDWNKLASFPGDEKESFEKFCFHIAFHKFGEYGTVSYFYNTPGSEFYIELNKPLEYAGKHYSMGDVIGWQAKYWKGAKDERNSPLDAGHIKELIEGFDKTIDYRANTKLWIVCSPGCFVQTQWDKLVQELHSKKEDCVFESWHKDMFEQFYLEDVACYNGIFQYYFGASYLGKEKLDSVSNDTLSILNQKFDADLHVPSEFERSLLSIVNDDIASRKLEEAILSLHNHSVDDQKKPILEEIGWGYKLLPPSFKKNYTEDCSFRYELINQLFGCISNETPLLQNVDEIYRLVSEYMDQRRPHVVAMNKDLHELYHSKKEDYGGIGYYLSELIERIHKLEDGITGDKEGGQDCLWDILCWLIKKDFSIFAEAGFGKTHLACSIANNMLERNLPVLFLMGSQFRNCNSCDSKLMEVLGLLANSTIDDVLDALSFIGEVYGCKLPIIIDGLNESAPNENRWKDELPPLKRKIRERQHLLLITTCREKEEYIEAIYGCKNYKEIENYIHLNGIAEKDLDNATERYFKKYNIQPTNIIDNSIFHNPLLLKIFCVTNRGKHGFELNEYSLASCMKDYSEQLLDVIATDNGKTNRIKRHAIECNLNKIAQLIWERNDRQLNYYRDFAPLFGEDTEKFLDEGMCFLLDRVGKEEQIQFSYDMVAGYHIAKSILGQCDNETDLCQYINKYYERFFGSTRHTLAEDIIKSLFYLIPIKYGKEWFELMPNEEVFLSAIDHLDTIISSESSRESFFDHLIKQNQTTVKSKITDCLFNRIHNQNNLSYFFLFVPFFMGMNAQELDKYWNGSFAGYEILDHVFSLIHDSCWANRYENKDKLVLSALLCGITNVDFRSKFQFELLRLTELDTKIGLTACESLISTKDPLVFESVVSVIAGIGLRTQEVQVLNHSISILENVLLNYASNHIVLLDDLETLYSYGEVVYGEKYAREKLYKNYDEIWPKEDYEEVSLYDIYDYDFEKYNIRPLYEDSYRHKALFSEKDIFGMLWKRMLDLGYNSGFYADIQAKDNDKYKYSSSRRYTYAHKFGRHALMDLYGWMMMHSYIENEFKGTFRHYIIDIDPSQPKVFPMRNFVSNSFMPRDLSELPSWIKSSDIEFMEQHLQTALPRTNKEWVLMRGYFSQKLENRHAHLYISATSKMVPADWKQNSDFDLEWHDSVAYDHAFMGELGWRLFEFTEEYDDESPLPRLLIKYSFSNWDSGRFQYQNLYCVNTIIAQRLGLLFDVKTLSYYFKDEKVSEYYVCDSGFFFYLRKDVVDRILEIYNAQLYYQIYESRMVDSSLPEKAPEMSEKYKNNKASCFYTVENGILSF